MSTSTNLKDNEAYRDSIATVDDRGKRVWIYPKKPKGRFTNIRNYVSWVLLAFLFGMPFIKVNGDPLLLFNVIDRRFILFGILFTPQDFHLFVLAMLTLIVFIILFTVVFGRLFCGWVCPQTIFMEMVFRKIEYWIEGDAGAQRRLNNSPWTTEKIFKKVGKQTIFFAIAVLVANTFLAYIIGIDALEKIITEPVETHIGGFTAMLAFSAAFYFVFSYLREQVCVTICPYGRLQGVLLDRNSIVIAYDFIRGEPRGKLTKQTKTKADPIDEIISINTVESKHLADITEPLPRAGTPVEAIKKSLGDCIDCKLCVQVCPTGIDIRNGTQLECVNCTACIDACDEVMDKIDRPRGLIRYDSYNGVALGRKRIFTPRVIAYTVLFGAMIALNIFLLGSRSDVEAVVLRAPGTLYQETPDGHISNLYTYQVYNKTTKPMPIAFKLVDSKGAIRLVGEVKPAEPGKMSEGAFFIDFLPADLQGRKNTVRIEVFSNGRKVDKVKTNFVGPIQ